MPLTQGCILIGFQAADEKVTLVVLLDFFEHIRHYHSLFYKFDVIYQ